MRQQTQQYLFSLQQSMQQLDLWQALAPTPEAFASTQPFALDTMEPYEWLQWIFIPRMQALLDANAPLPEKIAISPYLEEALEDNKARQVILAVLYDLEELLNKQDA